MKVVPGAPPLLHVEADEDFDVLLENIETTGYYSSDYFAVHSGYQPGRLGANFWFLAEMVRCLKPRRVLECGCGRGDALALLTRGGVDASGVDSSAAALAMAWPELRGRLHAGDVTQVCRRLAAAGERFDVVLGFDLWEHLHPRALRGAVEAAVAVSSDDALFFCVVPAFGRDRVFGEVFPTESAEMASDFAAGRPSRWLVAESTDPPIPAAGHLVWADAAWWQGLFESVGLRREEAVERKLHARFDRLLPASNRSFFIFSRDTAAGRARAESLARAPLSWVSFARMLTDLARAVRNGTAQERAARILIKRLLPGPTELGRQAAAVLRGVVSR